MTDTLDILRCEYEQNWEHYRNVTDQAYRVFDFHLVVTTILLSGILIGTGQSQFMLAGPIFLFVGIVELLWACLAIYLLIKLRQEFVLHVSRMNSLRRRLSKKTDNSLLPEASVWKYPPRFLGFGSAWTHRVLVIMGIALLVILICTYLAAADILVGYDQIWATLWAVWCAIISLTVMCAVLLSSCRENSFEYSKKLLTFIESEDDADDEDKKRIAKIVEDDRDYYSNSSFVLIGAALILISIHLISLLTFSYPLHDIELVVGVPVLIVVSLWSGRGLKKYFKNHDMISSKLTDLKQISTKKKAELDQSNVKA